MPADRNGILLIDKPGGMTSAGVVNRIGRILPGAKLGHGGTLDPFATGVLPVLIDRATRLSRFLLDGTKEYRGAIRFGWATDTFDIEGHPDGPPREVNIEPAALAQWTQSLQGRTTQRVPDFSSSKWKGKPRYYYARRGLPCPPITREVEIFKLEILEWSSPRLEILVQCQGGTYIRSIAQALGEMAGCGAHLTSLRRTRAGPFSIDQTIALAELEADPERVSEWIIQGDRLLPDLPRLTCSGDQERRIRHGNDIATQPVSGCDPGRQVRLFDAAERLLAIGEVISTGPEAWLIHPMIVLVD